MPQSDEAGPSARTVTQPDVAGPSAVATVQPDAAAPSNAPAAKEIHGIETGLDAAIDEGAPNEKSSPTIAALPS